MSYIRLFVSMLYREGCFLSQVAIYVHKVLVAAKALSSHGGLPECLVTHKSRAGRLSPSTGGFVRVVALCAV